MEHKGIDNSELAAFKNLGLIRSGPIALLGSTWDNESIMSWGVRTIDEIMFWGKGTFSTGGLIFLSLTTDCLQKKVFSKDTFSESDDAIMFPSISVGMGVVLFFCREDFVSLNQFLN